MIQGRCRKNNLNGLCINGEWKENPKEIKDKVFKFFQRNFKEDIIIRPTFRSRKFKKLDNSLSQMLEAPFSEEEMKDVV